MKKVYNEEERLETLKLANEIGNKVASERLGIKLDTLYTWVSKAKKGKASFVKEPQNISISEKERLKQLEKEFSEGKVEIEIL